MSDLDDHPRRHWEMTDQQAAERIAAVLVDLEQVHPMYSVEMDSRHHHANCWREHASCLAARIRRILTGEEPDRG